ncbi:MAG: hypothetical protein LJE88_08820 [Deltaproteobacteria bacterium]|nr:hypothetical protein [Deltaproteobacteria bacterium]
MKLRSFLTIAVLMLALSPGRFVLAASDHERHTETSSSGSMEHGQTGGTFTHQATADGVRAEFQVMSLASMNMKDPKGNTHHVMVKLFNATSNSQIKDAAGQIRIIGPSGKEQKEILTNYNGILAASFTFDEKDKYRMICVFDAGGKKGEISFWYPGGSM